MCRMPDLEQSRYTGFYLRVWCVGDENQRGASFGSFRMAHLSGLAESRDSDLKQRLTYFVAAGISCGVSP